MPLGWVAAGFGVVSLINSDQQSKKADYNARIAKGYMAGAENYTAQINQLLTDPSSIENDPAYQWTVKQGTTAVERKMAAAGLNNSGNMGVALTEYGQGVARSFLQDKIGYLQSLANFTLGEATPFLGVSNAYTQASNDSFNAGMQSIAGGFGYAAGQFAMGSKTGTVTKPSSTSWQTNNESDVNSALMKW